MEQATGIEGKGRESSHRGGKYYFYELNGENCFRLLNNRAIYDDEPAVCGCDDRPIVVDFEDIEADSDLVAALARDTEHFVFVYKQGIGSAGP